LRAPVDGLVIYSSPDEWIGRPLVTGERIATVANPARASLTLHLPAEDAIDVEVGAASGTSKRRVGGSDGRLDEAVDAIGVAGASGRNENGSGAVVRRAAGAAKPGPDSASRLAPAAASGAFGASGAPPGESASCSFSCSVTYVTSVAVASLVLASWVVVTRRTILRTFGFGASSVASSLMGVPGASTVARAGRAS